MVSVAVGEIDGGGPCHKQKAPVRSVTFQTNLGDHPGRDFAPVAPIQTHLCYTISPGREGWWGGGREEVGIL